MKSLIKIYVVIFILAVMLGITALSASARPSGEPVDVIETRYQNLFVFKANRNFLGASVKVYYSNGDLVTANQLRRRKMIIDFCDAREGEYTIVIRKGKFVETFDYAKK